VTSEVYQIGGKEIQVKNDRWYVSGKKLSHRMQVLLDAAFLMSDGTRLSPMIAAIEHCHGVNYNLCDWEALCDLAAWVRRNYRMPVR
jgi:hypothetical protein